jgi:hypothetical protein
MSDRYKLTKPGKGDVYTSLESVKFDYLADGYELTELAPAADDPADIYEAATVAELKDEIADRNKTRAEDNQIPSTGNKADLVAALVADDNA